MPTKSELEAEVAALKEEVARLRTQDSVAEAKLSALEIERLEESLKDLTRKNAAWEQRYSNVRDRALAFDKLAELFDKLRGKVG